MSVSLVHDDKLVVVFKNHAVKNDGKSKEAGRPIYDDMEICEVRSPGSRNVYAFPATAISHTSGDGMFGTEEVKVSYAERFAKQYQQFKAQQAQTVSGTPLNFAPFLTPGRCAELRALNIYTVEQLAAIDGIELKNIGGGGRELKNHALDYIDQSKANAPNLAALAELEQLKARNEVLEEDMRRLKALSPDHQYEDMTDQQLREYIQAHTGGAPKGDIPRKTLIRMAREATPSKAA